MKVRNLNSITLLTGAIVLAALGVAGVFWVSQKEPAKTSAQTTQQPKQEDRASAAYVSYKGKDGKTALDLLNSNAAVEAKDSSYGPYVDSINGVKGGTDGKYWAFYVNGEMATVGADAYQTKTGEKIEWKFQ
jgi:hypothetical protein